jgi:type I restriction enzyme M protein
VPLPPLEIQQEIVTEIEGYQKVIDGCRELMVKYEEKIKKVVDGVWGEPKYGK